MEGKKTIIFIAENAPALNKGEMTIIEGMLKSFEILGDVGVTMLSDHPEIDTPRYGTKVKIINIKKSLHMLDDQRDYSKMYRLSMSLLCISQHTFFLIFYKIFGPKILNFMKAEIWEEYVKSDIIIIGHDGAFSLGGTIGAPIYFYPLVMPFFAKILGKPVVLYGGSIGSLKKFPLILRGMIKIVLNNIDTITLREDVSYQHLKEIKFQNDNVSVTADPAFLLQAAPFERVKEIMKRESVYNKATALIGITVTREIASKAVASPTDFDEGYSKHIRMIAQVIDDITNRLNASVVFVPHCIGLSDELDDRIVANDIFQICKNQNKIKVITNEYGAGELKGLIGQFDLFIGERIHSVVNALSMYVPSIVISYSTDQRLGIIKMTEQENAICYVEDLDADLLISKIDEIWADKEIIKKELEYKMELIKNRAMHNGTLLKSVLNSRS